MEQECNLIAGRCSRPFDLLGRHIHQDKTRIRLWLPNALSVDILCSESRRKISSSDNSTNGLFSIEFKSSLLAQDAVYKVKANYIDTSHEFIDPYQFSEHAYHAVHFVDHAPENLYAQIGAQLLVIRGIKGTRFAVFAPNASAVSLIGDFNLWNDTRHPMQKTDLGYWVLFMPELGAGSAYKFAIKDTHGHRLPDKQDPLGFHHQQHPSHCSLVYDHSNYTWQDHQWFENKSCNPYQEAISVYEVHLGSWKRTDSKEGKNYLSYDDLSQQLIRYVKDMGFTHIEVLPVSEFPFDGSWGYQPVGLFAPTSRFGDPDHFKAFVDSCHQHGIGVIIDWVPAHFPEDPHGLACFDGSHLYEYEDPKKGWHPDWHSCIYDFGKQTVRQFLVANALYWFDKFHIDGIRVDAVASMLYLDYSRNEGQWLPNVDGGNHNYEAISLLKWMNTEVYKKYPHALTIAEESTSFSDVSKPVEQGGLGFGFKWNMGWMHDSLGYFAKDCIYRKHHHGELSFSMVYAFDENFVLAISHDEVVHGKGSMIEKMPGDPWQKAANLRAYYTFMFAHPGKKLQFMGNEFAQIREWNHDSSLDWHLIDTDNTHTKIQTLYRSLNHLYKAQSSLSKLDHSPLGFEWLDLDNAEHSIYSFIRRCDDEYILVACNFTPVPHDLYRLGCPQAGTHTLLFNSDHSDFGGSDYPILTKVNTTELKWQNHNHSIEINLPPLAVVYYKLSES